MNSMLFPAGASSGTRFTVLSRSPVTTASDVYVVKLAGVRQDFEVVEGVQKFEIVSTGTSQDLS